MFPLFDTQSTKRFSFWVIIIILVNIYAFYLELVSPNSTALISHYALIPNQISFDHPQSLLPLITSEFLHGGFLHIISNMLFLWVFGTQIESAFGFLFFPFFYLACGVIAGLTQYYISPTDTVPIIGASGAIAGVLGAYFALFPTRKIKTLLFIIFFVTIADLPAWIMLIYWFAIQILHVSFAVGDTTASAGGIAYAAHIGGFLTGLLTAKLLTWKYSVKRPIGYSV